MSCPCGRIPDPGTCACEQYGGQSHCACAPHDEHPMSHLRGDARKALAERTATLNTDAATTAGRTALRDAAKHLADVPSAAGFRVWLDTYAGTWTAGGS